MAFPGFEGGDAQTFAHKECTQDFLATPLIKCILMVRSYWLTKKAGFRLSCDEKLLFRERILMASKVIVGRSYTLPCINEAPWCKMLGGVPHGHKFVRMIIVRHVL